MMIGSSPISTEVLQFFKVTLGVNILEAYGTTETCSIAAISLAHDYTLGTVGTPLLCNKIKLIDAPYKDLIVNRDRKGEVI